MPVPREDTVNKQALCPYCQTSIEIGIEKVYCNRCNLPYHKDCWHENSGCAAFGCKQKVSNCCSNRLDADIGFIDLTTEELPEISAASINGSTDSHLEGDRMTNTSTNEIKDFIIWFAVLTIIYIILRQFV